MEITSASSKLFDLFVGIFPTQGSNPGLLCCRQMKETSCKRDKKQLIEESYQEDGREGQREAEALAFDEREIPLFFFFFGFHSFFFFFTCYKQRILLDHVG